MSDSKNNNLPAYYPSYDHKEPYQQYPLQSNYYPIGPSEHDHAWTEKLVFDLQKIKKEKVQMENEIRIFLFKLGRLWEALNDKDKQYKLLERNCCPKCRSNSMYHSTHEDDSSVIRG